MIAYNHFIAIVAIIDVFIVDEAFTVVELHLGRLSTMLTSWHTLPQEMGTLFNVLKESAVPERRLGKAEMTIIKHFLHVRYRIRWKGFWNPAPPKLPLIDSPQSLLPPLKVAGYASRSICRSLR